MIKKISMCVGSNKYRTTPSHGGDRMMEIQAYAAYSKDDEIRRQSSSGGIFYEIAKVVLQQGGIVFGAKFDEKWNVIHGHADTIEGLQKFCGSKYVQSDIGNEYVETKRKFDEGKVCLFSGTPCQIAGLKAYLRRDYFNLITVDFICHGVPSRAVWREYVVQRKGGREIEKINFREKTEGWLKYSLRMDFKDGTIYRKNVTEDLYMKGFLQDVYLRPSCYECAFKGIARPADITLADYWGIEKDFSEMFDDKGISAVFVRGKTGAGIWQKITEKVECCNVNLEMPVVHNQAMLISVDRPEKRAVFYRGRIADFRRLKRITKDPLIRKIKRKVKNGIRKLIRRK